MSTALEVTEAPKAPAAPDLESIAREIEDNLTSLLGLDAGTRIDRKRKLKTVGMDSLLAMDLLTALEARHGQLPETVLRDHPTVQELAEYLFKQRLNAG